MPAKRLRLFAFVIRLGKNFPVAFVFAIGVREFVDHSVQDYLEIEKTRFAARLKYPLRAAPKRRHVLFPGLRYRDSLRKSEF